MMINLTCMVAVVALLGVMAEPAASQVLYGSLTGNVTDASGGAILSAKVEALNTGTGISKTSTTDERGVYIFNDLQPGTYKVTITAAGFAGQVREAVNIVQNTVLRLDASLQVTGQAGDYQVEGARTFQTLNIGGSGTTSVSFVVGV